MTFLGPDQGSRLSALGSTYTTKAATGATGGAYWLAEEEFWGRTTPLHAHTTADEAFFVLSGRVAVWLDGAETEAGPGAFTLVRQGRAHALRRLSDEPARMLTLVSPAGMENFFAAVVEHGEDDLLADPARLVALADEHGTRILGDHPGP
ncbi:Cupin domain-containing protein [Blastococcus aurantiacus]|uniref:Cupin domain-containing protein n=1 Tax=Blastococcus aurantiacus TaxID=1550231 RepID=A0A1G7LDC3_9ACTN|nr:cupin domain-containing protein [Blastococcus aurantiacus]SDF47488.1 Cupin domain-containing protein [Blastococcus aurantiacus]